MKVVATRGIIDLILCKRNSEQRTLINWIISFLYCAYLMRNQSICIMHLIHKYWTKVSVHVKCNVQENRFLSDYMFVKWCVSLWCFYAILIDICIFHVKSDGCKLQWIDERLISHLKIGCVSWFHHSAVEIFNFVASQKNVTTTSAFVDAIHFMGFPSIAFQNFTFTELLSNFMRNNRSEFRELTEQRIVGTSCLFAKINENPYQIEKKICKHALNEQATRIM